MERKRNEEEKVDLKHRIIRKATVEFARKGIKEVRMDDISSSLGISKRTLYMLFADKEELLIECILYTQRFQDRLLARIYHRSHNVLDVILGLFENIISVFQRTNKDFFEDIKKYPRALEMVKQRQQHDAENTAHFFRQGIEQGIFRTDVNFSIMNILVHEQFNTLFQTHLYDGYSLVEVYESIIFTYVRGISTEYGVKLLDKFIADYRNKQNQIK